MTETAPHRVFSIPIGNGFGLIRLSKAEMGRTLAPDAAIDALLAEAIRFYGLGQGGECAIIEKRLPPISGTVLVDKASRTGKAFGARISAELAQLWTPKGLRAATNLAIYGEPYADALIREWYGAQILAVDVMTRPEARKPGATVTALEVLSKTAVEARGLLSVERIYSEAAGIESECGGSISKPFLGGCWSLSPMRSNSRPITFGARKGTRLTIPGGGWLSTKGGELTGVYDLQASDVGLAEKLYFCSALDVLLVGADGGTVPSEYDSEAKALNESLSGLLRGLPRPFQAVHDALDAIDDHFGSILWPRSERQRNRLRAFGIDSQLLRRTGLEWSFLLTGLLRAYCVWLEAVSYLLEIPWTKLYQEFAGTLVAAMMERVLGFSFTNPHSLRPSEFYPTIRYAPAPVTPRTRLTVMRTPSGPTEERPSAGEALKAPASPDSLSAAVKYLDERISALPKVVSSPIIAESFYERAGVQRTPWSEREVGEARTLGQRHTAQQRQASPGKVSFVLGEGSFAARLECQLGLYSASKILSLALEALNIPQAERQHLVVGCASQPWAGKFQPHDTHREGLSYDLDYRPSGQDRDLISWPMVAKSKEILKALKPADLNRLTSCTQWKKHRPDYLLQLPGDSPRFVVRSYLRDFLRSLSAGLLGWRHFQDFESRFTSLRSSLDGTPVPAGGSAGLAMHAAHFAILMSAPAQIIWGSPLTNANCVYAIKSALKADAPELLEKMRPVEFVFFPHNHHDHWHVDYPAAGTPEAIVRLGDALMVGRSLGVNYEDFLLDLKDWVGRWTVISSSPSLPPDALITLVEAKQKVPAIPGLIQSLCNKVMETSTASLQAYNAELPSAWNPLIECSAAVHQLFRDKLLLQESPPLKSIYLIDEEIDAVGLDDVVSRD